MAEAMDHRAFFLSCPSLFCIMEVKSSSLALGLVSPHCVILSKAIDPSEPAGKWRRQHVLMGLLKGHMCDDVYKTLAFTVKRMYPGHSHAGCDTAQVVYDGRRRIPGTGIPGFVDQDVDPLGKGHHLS